MLLRTQTALARGCYPARDEETVKSGLRATCTHFCLT